MRIITFFLLCVLACCQAPGSGSGGGSGATLNVAGINTMPITVGSGAVCNNPSGTYPNEPCVTVTICVPNTPTCQTISDIILDTGSVGLRLFSSAVKITLPQETYSSLPVAECAMFGSSNSWGNIVSATLTLGQESPVTVPTQLINPTFANKYSSTGSPVGTSICSGNSIMYSPSNSEYNGILGVGILQNDAQYGSPHYYTCSGTVCNNVTLPQADYVGNPVTFLSQDNNGVLIELPPVNSSGTSSAQGTLVFGVDTESNNSSIGLTAFSASNVGDIDSTFNGNSEVAYFDSGSNGLYFYDTGVATCSGYNSSWYCPSSTLSLPVTISGTGGTPSENIYMSVADASNLFSTSNSAFDDLAGVGTGGVVDLGLSYFYGKIIGLVINAQYSGAGTGPLFLAP